MSAGTACGRRSLKHRVAAGAAALLIGIVRSYRLLLSPWLGSQCRFEPTCSRYALEALQSHGAAQGSYLAARRILRCHPWCPGGLDPVPPVPSVPCPRPSPSSPTTES